jgi:hypothetical protein
MHDLCKYVEQWHPGICWNKKGIVSENVYSNYYSVGGW